VSRHLAEHQLRRRASGLVVPAHLAGDDLVPAHHIGAPAHRPRPLSNDIAEMAAIAERHRMQASTQTWKECLAVQRAAGTLFSAYTTAKSVINPDALWDMPRNWLQPGRQLELVVTGAVSSLVTTPGLMNFQLKIGSVAAFDTGNIQLNATAHVTLPFMLYVLLTCRAAGNGTTANLIGLADVTGRMFTLTAGQTDDAQGMQSVLAPAIAPAVGTGFDSTIANLVDFWVGFTISNAANGVQIHQYSLTAVN
jgi:hypothetical protein